MIFNAFLIATVILVLFTLLPMLRYEAWWIRSLDFPRLQLLVVSLLLLFTLSSICRLRSFGSDHFALFAELVFEKGGDSRQTALQADQDDLDWAKSKADSQSVSEDDVPRPGAD